MRLEMESEKDTLPRITATVPEPTTGPLSFEELQLANRNRGLPLEALRYDITPCSSTSIFRSSMLRLGASASAAK
jgi:hypothetical protein